MQNEIKRGIFMEMFELSPLSFFLGIATVIGVALLRFHFPFRYQYFCYFVKNRPKLIKKILTRSYLKNKSAVGILDKATSDILAGSYDDAEKHILEGINLVLNSGGARNQIIRNYLFNHLSWLLYYKGLHRESLEIALRLYEKIPSTPNILALISCNFARIGEIGKAIEIKSEYIKKGKTNPSVILSCEAEIEAAKGNLQKAVELFNKAKKKKSYISVCFHHPEIEKRIGQLTKAA